MTTRRGTYPRGTYRFRPRRLVKRKRTVRRVVRRSSKLHTRKRPASMLAQGDSKRRRTYRDRNQYQQLDTLVSRRGRKISTTRFHHKLVSAAYNFSKWQLRAYGLDNAGGAGDTGLRALTIDQVGPAGGVQLLPIYLFNLTTVPQRIGGTWVNNTAGWRLTTSSGGATATSAMSWVSFSMLNAAGSNVSPGVWNCYNSTNSASSGFSMPKALLEYLNIKYTLRGPSARPTRFIVEVIQPYKWFNALPSDSPQGTGDYNSQQNGVWVAEATRLTANMCQNAPLTFRKPWKVLMSKVYEVQPTSTTETDVGGHDVHQRHFYKCNRVLNYHDTSGQTAGDGNYNDLDTVDNEAGYSLSCEPAPGTRMYLLVKAYAPNLTTASSAATSPSFDINIERKFSTLAAVSG